MNLYFYNAFMGTFWVGILDFLNYFVNVNKAVILLFSLKVSNYND